MTEKGTASPPNSNAAQVTFVLATVNEAKCLPVLLPAIEGECDRPYEVLVVDDGSTDGTREYLAERAEAQRNLRTILNTRRQSTLRAHLQGLQVARGKFAVVMDSDLQHPAAAIPQMLDQLDRGFDIVVASRYLAGGSTGDRAPLRGLISRVAAVLARAAVPQSRPLTDPLSGFIALRTEVVPPMKQVHRGFKILLLLLSTRRDLRLVEVPFEFQERAEGASKVVGDLGFLRTFLFELVQDRRILRSVPPAGRIAKEGADPPGATARAARRP